MNICVLRLHGETSAWSYLEVLLGPPPGWDREVFGMTEFWLWKTGMEETVKKKKKKLHLGYIIMLAMNASSLQPAPDPSNTMPA